MRALVSLPLFLSLSQVPIVALPQQPNDSSTLTSYELDKFFFEAHIHSLTHPHLRACDAFEYIEKYMGKGKGKGTSTSPEG